MQPLLSQIKVVIADSNRLIRVGLDVVLKQQKEISVIGEAGSPRELKALLRSFDVDIVLIDFTSIGFTIDVIPEILADKPQIRFLAITPDQSAMTIVNALRAGVTSYIKKDCDFKEIVDSVMDTGAGNKFFCGKILDTIRKESIDVNDLELAALTCEPVSLSEREQEIIVLIAEGLTNNQIADKLFLSTHTINTHRKNIMQKLGVNNTASIVMYAVKSNLIDANRFLFSAS